MSNLNTQKGQEGFGIYGWDLTNPYLQDLYKRPDEPDNLVEKLPPSYETPAPSLPKFQTPFINQEVTRPPYQTMPLSEMPSMPTPQPPKRTIRSFGEGMGLAGKRFLNDMKYSMGYIGDKLSADKSEQSKDALNHLPEYERSTDSQLETRRDSLKREVERIPSPLTENELKGLEDYQRMRQKGMSQQEIKQELSDMAQWGTKGRKQMEEAFEANEEFPISEDGAILGEIATGLGRTALPTLIGLASAPVGIAVGAGTVLSSIAESYAQSQMELDSYEKMTGEKLSKIQRASFTTINVATDFLVEGIMQSRFLKNITPTIKKKASKQFKKHILSNHNAQHEVKSLFSRLKMTEKQAMVHKIEGDIGMGAINEALSSLAHDAATTIYRNPEDYPTLKELFRNMASGLIFGGVTGGITSGIGTVGRQYKRNAERNKRGSVAVLRTDKGAVEVVDSDPRNQSADIINDYGDGISHLRGIRGKAVRTFDWKEQKNNIREMKAIEEPDPLYKIDRDPHKEVAWASMSPLGKRNLIIDLAERMNIYNIEVFQHISDIPREALTASWANSAPEGSFYLHNGYTAIILDKVKGYNHLQHLLLYEAVAQQGLRSLFGGNLDLYNSFLMNVYDSMPESSKSHGNTKDDKFIDAKNYITDLAASGVESIPLRRILGGIKDPLSLYYPGLEVSDDDIKKLIVKAREELRSPISQNAEWQRQVTDIGERPFSSHDYPLTGISESTLRYFQEYDPLWKKYKRFYDEVYGEDDPDDPNITYFPD